MSNDAHMLPFLLLGGFRSLIDQLHAELAHQGHPDIRPAHGFALQAVATGADTATAVGQALGVSKQAAAHTLEALERFGYVVREGHPDDRRKSRILLTVRGRDLLACSARALERLHGEWANRMGPRRMDALMAGLRQVAGIDSLRLDAAGWLAG